MRKLTIKRNKSFVACLGKMKVYIEDPAGELIINQVPCRKLGTLKNGEQQSFQVGEQAAKVYIIADKLSKDYCNEYYQLPEGQEDIYLTGKNKYNPVNGNPFRFDNNENQGAVQNRKRGVKIGLIVLAVAVAVGLIVGGIVGVGIGIFENALEPKMKTFSVNGMSITLTSGFRDVEAQGYTSAYESRNIAVFTLEEKIAEIPELKDCTLEEYAEMLIEINKRDAQVKTTDGLTGFDYTWQNPDTKEVFHYYIFVYQAKDAFWLIQFGVAEASAQSYEEQIYSWAKTVTFAD